jgi:hypothetical protein
MNPAEAGTINNPKVPCHTNRDLTSGCDEFILLRPGGYLRILDIWAAWEILPEVFRIKRSQQSSPHTLTFNIPHPILAGEIDRRARE